jgi:hypothetical protein
MGHASTAGRDFLQAARREYPPAFFRKGVTGIRAKRVRPPLLYPATSRFAYGPLTATNIAEHKMVEMKMIRSTSLATGLKRVAAAGTLLGLVAIGTAVAPTPANAWWRGGGYGWCCGVGIYVPPVVIAPPVYVAPGPAYAAPQRVWSRPHWENGYWVQGHWG